MPKNGQKTIIIDGRSLTIEQIVEVARGINGVYSKVHLNNSVRDNIVSSRKAIEEKIPFQIMYGINTGCGSNRDEIIPREDLLKYQVKYILAHSCGTGRPLQKDIARAMILLRANSFAVGNSGVTIELIEKLLWLLNEDIIPVIPKHGSLGASGDLIPLAHLGTVLIGTKNSEVYYKDKRIASSQMYKLTNQDPIELQPKEAMALTNGSSLMLAYASLEIFDIEKLLKIANLCCALNMEAIRAEVDALDARLHKARNQKGQNSCAAEIRRFLKNSKRVTKEAQEIQLPHDYDRKCDSPRVQDAYSTRCAPQAHGAVSDAIEYAKNAIIRELNAATDNPLIFKKQNGEFDVISGGNFHGDPLAIPLETLGVAMAKLTSISQARVFRLINNQYNFGLPQDLSGSKDASNSGMMIMHYSDASHVNRNQTLAAPAAVGNIPTANMQEDYVSMGATSAWKLHKIIGNSQSVFAIELLASCQAISLAELNLGEYAQLGEYTQKVYSLIRKHIPPMIDDRDMNCEIQLLRKLIKDGNINHLLI